ncbi:MAG: hypothetical protein ACJAUJ_001001 [Salibacteraceae bacterium]|jgi:hypothetical protein
MFIKEFKKAKLLRTGVGFFVGSNVMQIAHERDIIEIG